MKYCCNDRWTVACAQKLLPHMHAQGEAPRAHQITLWERARPRLFGETYFAISTIRANRVFSFSANHVSGARTFAALAKYGFAFVGLLCAV